MMPSYIGTSIEDKPAWMKRGEKLHREMHRKMNKTTFRLFRKLLNILIAGLITITQNLVRMIEI